jgi:hypothetical protein
VEHTLLKHRKTWEGLVDTKTLLTHAYTTPPSLEFDEKITKIHTKKIRKMKTEIQHAVTFLVETLKDKLLGTCNLDFEDTMRTRLTDLLAERYENHWYADKPLKGSAYRCINISVEENSFDVTLRTAAIDSGLTEEIVRGVFLNGLALWVDPDDVSGRLGKGAIFPIYKKIAEKPAAVSNPYQSMQSPQLSSTPQHRPQQRPRSISPPQSQAHVSYPDTAPPSRPITTTVSRPSKTPPGFRSLDAGQNFYNVQQQQQQQQAQVQNAGQRSDFPSNIQKLWRNPTSHTRTSTGSMSQHSHMNNSSRHPTTYVSSASGNNKYNSTTSDDAVYSFNQYSSYYNPHFHWRKDNQTPSQSEAASASANKGAYVPLKSLWQDDESYQRTHWFADSTSKSNTNKLSVAGNNLSINKVQNYGYSISRQAQEVY